jgi:hypothetical protein
MSIPVALLVVVGAAIAAALLMGAMHRLAGRPLLDDPARGTTMITIAGTAFAVLLAFITLDAFQTYSGAKDAAESEAAATLEMFRTGEFFPADEREELRSDFVCYGRAVVEQEWPAMREGRRSPVVDAWVARYRDDFHSSVDLHSAREQLGFEELLAEERARTEGRRGRLSQAVPSVPSPLWFVLILGGCVAVLLQLSMADPRERLRVQGAMIAGVAAIVAAGLLLVHFLDHPYAERAGSVEPTEMRETLVMMTAADPGLRVPCDSGGRPLVD